MVIGVRKRILNYALWAACEDSGKSRKTLAEEMGISIQSLYHFMSLKKYPSKSTQAKIADYFMVDKNDLFPEEIEHLIVEHQPEPEIISLEDALVAGLIHPLAEDWTADVEQAELTETINDILDGLSDRASNIIQRYYGLNGHEAQTMTSIATDMGVSKARISQIIARSMRIMRHPSRSKRLRGYVFHV